MILHTSNTKNVWSTVSADESGTFANRCTTAPRGAIAILRIHIRWSSGCLVFSRHKTIKYNVNTKLATTSHYNSCKMVILARGAVRNGPQSASSIEAHCSCMNNTSKRNSKRNQDNSVKSLTTSSRRNMKSFLTVQYGAHVPENVQMMLIYWSHFRKKLFFLTRKLAKKGRKSAHFRKKLNK